MTNRVSARGKPYKIVQGSTGSQSLVGSREKGRRGHMGSDTEGRCADSDEGEATGSTTQVPRVRKGTHCF